jgi:hypothetical protein
MSIHASMQGNLKFINFCRFGTQQNSKKIKNNVVDVFFEIFDF